MEMMEMMESRGLQPASQFSVPVLYCIVPVGASRADERLALG